MKSWFLWSSILPQILYTTKLKFTCQFSRSYGTIMEPAERRGFFFNLHRFNWNSIEYLHWMWLIFQIKAKRRGSHRCGPRPACEGPNVGQTLSNRELKQWKQRAHPRDQGRPDCRPQAGPLIMTMASWIYVQEEYLALIHWNRNCLHSQRW